MIISLRMKLAVVLGLILASLQVSNGFASDATQQLQSSVQRLNARLGTGAKSEGWRRYLYLNILETQAAKGEQADIAVLQNLHSRFASGAAGLDHPVFADVRYAIEKQIANLSSSYVGDLNQAVAAAANQYQPITVGQMTAYRDLLKNEIDALRNFYRMNLPSDQRAEIFYALKLDDIVSFIDQIEFELAPEVSVGKMESAIRQVQQQLDEVVRKIDAMPVDNPPEEEGSQPNDKTPTPDDDDDSLKELEAKKENLEKKISELREQRSEIRKQDLPRLRKRADTFVKLRAFEKSFEDMSRDLGDPYFVSTKLALERFVRAYFYGTDDNLQEDFLLRIQRLAKELPNLSNPQDRRAAGVVGNSLEWLENSFQVPHLVTAIRNRYSQPNAYVNVSTNFINRVGAQSLSETQPVKETILGRLVKGCATTVGNVTFDFQNDPNQVHVSLRLNATVNSNTYTQQGRITAYINSTGLAEFRRSIYANVGGFYADHVYGGVNVNSCFAGTSSRLGLVDRIGQRQFDKTKIEAEGIAAERIRGEVQQRFLQQTDDALNQGKSRLGEAQKNLTDKSNLIPAIYARSQSDKVVLVAKGSNKANLAAPGFPVQYPQAIDIGAQVNDSILSNFVDPIFRGKTYTDEQLADELEELLGERPEALSPKEGAEKDQSFSITFTNIRPIQFEFENGRLSVIVSGRQFSQGDTKIEEGLKIIVHFRLVRMDGKLKLVRDGKAEIDYVNPDEKSSRTVAFRSFLDGRLNPQDADDQMEVDLPSNLIPVEKFPELKNNDIVQRLYLSQFRIENGWLYVGWNYMPPGSYMSMPLDTPSIENISTAPGNIPSGQPMGNNSVPQPNLPMIVQPMEVAPPAGSVIVPSPQVAPGYQPLR